MTSWLLWNRQASRGGGTAAGADASRSPQMLAQVFSRAALERYVPRLQGALRQEVRSWCAARGPVAVFEAAKALTFRMAARILLGLRLDEAQCAELARTFQQFVENLFSLPLDVPFSGLRKVLPRPPPAPDLTLGAPQRGRVSQPKTRLPPESPTSLPCWGIEAWPGRGGSVVLCCAPHPFWAASDATCPAPAAAGLLTLGLGGRRSVSLPSPCPEQPHGPASDAPLETRVAAERMGASGLQTCPRPGPAPALCWRGRGCPLPARGPWPASFPTRESQPLQTAERWAGPREQLGNLVLPFFAT